MIVSLLLMLAGGVLTIMGHPWGMAPIVAAVVCAGSFLRRRDMLIIGLGAMLLHDMVLGLSLFTLVRLAAIAGVIGVVQWLRVTPRPLSLGAGVVLAAPVYQVILAVGDWATHFCTTQPRTLAGLQATLFSAWPYMQQSFFSDLAFTAAFLGLYTCVGYVLRTRWPALVASRS